MLTFIVPPTTDISIVFRIFLIPEYVEEPGKDLKVVRPDQVLLIYGSQNEQLQMQQHAVIFFVCVDIGVVE